MAQLKDTIVTGNLRVTDTVLTDELQVDVIKTYSSSGANTMTAGIDGQILKTNGTSSYWGSVTLDNVTDGTTRKLSDYALKASPALSGTPTAPTATAGTNTTQIATTAFVTSAINALPEPMIFKGTLGTGGTITSLPAAAAGNTGYTYKVITNGTYQLIAAKAGDTFISNGSSWTLIPSGDEPSGTVTNVATGTGLIGGPITTTGTISIDTDVVALKSDVPTAVTEATVAGWGFTKNTGTLTTETDPVYSASAAAGITSSDIANWNNVIAGPHGYISEYDGVTGIMNINGSFCALPEMGDGTEDFLLATVNQIPTESTVSDWGFTKNTGTLTGVKFNGTSASVSGGVASITATIPAAPGTLITNATAAQTASAGEAMSGSITLHKIAKTGTYSDLIGKPTIPAAPGTLNTNNTTAQTAKASEALSGTISLHKVAKTGTYSDLIGTPTIPTESTVSGWGFTKNSGTVTSVKIGTTSYSPSSGVVSLPAYPTDVSTNKVNGASLSNSSQYFYGTSTTAAATAQKEVTISGITELNSGLIIVVQPTVTSTVANSTLKLNDFDAHPMRYKNAAITTSTDSVVWNASYPTMWVFNGTYWVCLAKPEDANSTYAGYSFGFGYAISNNTASTVARTATLSNYSLGIGGITAVKFTTDVVASATLNINSKGAKALYYKGSPITADLIKAGDLVTVVYTTNAVSGVGADAYHILTIDRIIDNYMTQAEVTNTINTIFS